jgi:hypothetical protein
MKFIEIPKSHCKLPLTQAIRRVSQIYGDGERFDLAHYGDEHFIHCDYVKWRERTGQHAYLPSMIGDKLLLLSNWDRINTALVDELDEEGYQAYRKFRQPILIFSSKIKKLIVEF